MLKKMSQISIMSFFRGNRNGIENIYNLGIVIEYMNWTEA